MSFNKSNTSESFPQIKAHFEQYENLNLNVQNYHKLIKMKKVLLDAENKINNRIKLFHKTSQKILKRKQNNIRQFQKIQKIKKDPFFSRAKLRPKSRQHYLTISPKVSQIQLRNTKYKQNTQPAWNFFENDQNESNKSHRKVFLQKANQARIQNARSIKQDRQRNKIIIEQRKKKQLSRKLQSANIIRRQRQNAKFIKQKCMKQRHEDFKKVMEQKYQKQKEQYNKLQQHLQQLQQQQKQALIYWKKTVDS